MRAFGERHYCRGPATYNQPFVVLPIPMELWLLRNIGAAIAIVPFMVAAWFWPRVGDRIFTRLEEWCRKVSLRRSSAVFGAALLVIALRFSVCLLIPTPVPHNHDEFSYLLAADTFAHGRLANPPHPMWVYLETFHVNQFPTYVSKYPPAQGMMLALGQILGHPWIGVVLSVAGLCGTITWALQGWVPRRWALLGGVLAATTFGAANYWIDSYWGGAVAGLGGALVIGAFPRVLRYQRVRDALLLALGMGILANSRPYEGLIFSVPIVATLVWRLSRSSKPGLRIVLLRVALPMTSVLLVAGTFIGYYNWRVTGSPALLPYVVNDRAYAIEVLEWRIARPSHTYLNPQFDTFYNAPPVGSHRTGFNSMWRILTTAPAKLLKLQGFYATPELGIPIAISLCCLFKNKKVQFCFSVCAVVIAGLLCIVWLLPHYAAPFTAAAYVLIVFGFRRLRIWWVHGKPVGLGLARSLVVFHGALLLASLAASALVLRSNHEPWDRGQARARIQAKLESTSGQHLVLVRYSAAHNPNQEWVYNRADIDHAKVVWAREIPGRSIQPLLDYFHGRNFWLLQPDVNPPLLRLFQSSTRQDR